MEEESRFYYEVGCAKVKISTSNMIGANMQGFANEEQMISTVGDLFARTFIVKEPGRKYLPEKVGIDYREHFHRAINCARE